MAKLSISYRLRVMAASEGFSFLREAAEHIEALESRLNLAEAMTGCATGDCPHDNVHECVCALQDQLVPALDRIRVLEEASEAAAVKLDGSGIRESREASEVLRSALTERDA